MTRRDEAEAHREALMGLGWACGTVRVTDDGTPCFVVVVPAHTVGRGRKARTVARQQQTRSWPADGSMVIDARPVAAWPALVTL